MRAGSDSSEVPSIKHSLEAGHRLGLHSISSVLRTIAISVKIHHDKVPFDTGGESTTTMRFPHMQNVERRWRKVQHVPHLRCFAHATSSRRT